MPSWPGRATEALDHPCRGCLARLVGGAHLRSAGEQLNDRLAHSVELGPKGLKDLESHPFALPDEAEENVLSTDVVLAELHGLSERELQSLLGTGRERDLAGPRRLMSTDDCLNSLPDDARRDAEGFECLRADTVTLTGQPKEQVLGAQVVVFQHRLLLSECDHLTRTVREPLEHLTRIGSAQSRRAASLVSLPAGEPTGHRPLYSQVLASTARAVARWTPMDAFATYNLKAV
jgi:hypothetical protein